MWCVYGVSVGVDIYLGIVAILVSKRCKWRFEFALEKLLNILNFLTQKFALQSQSLRTRHDPGTPRKRRRRSGSAEAEARKGNPPEITSPNRFNAASKTPTPAAPNHNTPLSNAQVQWPSMKGIKNIGYTPCHKSSSCPHRYFWPHCPLVISSSSLTPNHGRLKSIILLFPLS